MPLYVGALYWKGSTKWGALAATLWVAGATIALFYAPRGFTVWGLAPVVPMTLGAAFLLWLVSTLTPKPSANTVERYFSV